MQTLSLRPEHALECWRVMADLRMWFWRHDSYNLHPPMVFGGYLRDRLLDRPPVDMDVMVVGSDLLWRNFELNPPPGWRKLTTGELVARTGDESFVARVPDGELYAATNTTMPSFSQGYYAVAGVETPVNLVSAAQYLAPMALARAQDFGLCQVVYDGKWLYPTDGFRSDLRQRVLRLRGVGHRSPAQMERSMKRGERLSARLGIRFIAPEAAAVA